MRSFRKSLRALRWRLVATRRLWSRGSKPKAQMLLLRARAGDAGGAIDQPNPDRVVYREVITIAGWALFGSTPTARIEVYLGDHHLGRARLGLPRPDVDEAVDAPGAATAGFELVTNLAHWPGDNGDAELRAVVHGVGGQRLDLDPVTLSIVPVTTGRPALVGTRRGSGPPTPSPDLDGPRLLVLTHQLDLGGAQLYLVDLLSALAGLGAARPTVVSAMDGQTRAPLEELGIPVTISGIPPIDDGGAHREWVEEIASWAARGDFEAVLINTATAFSAHGGEIAGRLGVPAIWAIHESFEPAALWSGVDPDVRRRAERGLSGAALAIFEADATRRLFEPVVGAERCVTIPYGIDLTPVEERRAGFDRAAARAAAGIPDEAEVLLCIGTIEPRKSQVALSQAFELVAGRHPDARLVFVGGREDPESRLLAARIEETPTGERMDLIPVTPDVHTWHGISDVYVSASDLESVPRTVLEAMAWERPVLATDVFGLPELIDDGRTGWLCAARDVEALAGGIDRALSAGAEERAAIGLAARARVVQRHSLAAYGREIAGLLAGVVERPPVPNRVAVD